MISLARLFGWVGVIGIVIFSLVPGNFRPEAPPAAYIEAWLGYSGFGARLEHFAAYLWTACFLGIGYRSLEKRFGALIMLLVLAALLEYAQHWVVGRTADFRDFEASSIGACVGTLAVFATSSLHYWLSRASG